MKPLSDNIIKHTVPRWERCYTQYKAGQIAFRSTYSPYVEALKKRRNIQLEERLAGGQSWRAVKRKLPKKNRTGRTPVSKKLRFQILNRDGFSCQYCGRAATDSEVVLQVDHVIPVSGGGTNDESNLVAACYECNIGKGANLIRGEE